MVVFPLQPYYLMLKAFSNVKCFSYWLIADPQGEKKLLFREKPRPICKYITIRFIIRTTLNDLTDNKSEFWIPIIYWKYLKFYLYILTQQILAPIIILKFVLDQSSCVFKWNIIFSTSYIYIIIVCNEITVWFTWDTYINTQ